LPVVVLVTGAVFAVPIVVVWQLRSHGAVTSIWLAILIALAVSVVLSWALQAYWTRGVHRTDLLFSELMLWGWLSRLRSERQLRNAATMLWLLEQETVSGQLRRMSQSEHDERLRLVQRLANAVDAQDVYLHGHSRRVARHADKIGRKLGLSGVALARLRAAAIAHDIGKVAVPRRVLDKPGPLTTEEFELIKRHPVDGARIVAVLGDREIAAIVLHHHERYDGAGYPAGLAGEAIPLGARIVAVADTFDAITSLRPYRPGAQHREAIATLRESAGTQLDPDVVRAFLSSYAGRRPAFFLAGILAAPQQALARLVAGRQTSPATTAANAMALVAATAAVAAAAGAPGNGASGDGRQLSAKANVPRQSSVLAAHIRRARSHAAAARAPSKAVKRSSGSTSGRSSRIRGSSTAGGPGNQTSASGGGSGTGGSGSGGTPSSLGLPPHPGRGSEPGIGGKPSTGNGGGKPSQGGGTQTGSPAPPQTTTTTSPTQTGPSSGGQGGGSPGGGGSSGPTYSQLGAGTTTCDGVYGGSGGSVIVPSGATCTLVSGTQVGSVTVQPGGTLIAQGVSVTDDLQSSGGVTICGSSVGHDLRVQNSAGSVTIGGSCAGNTIGHDLDVEHNAGGVVVGGNQVGHDMNVEGNGGATVSGNSAGHDANCDPSVSGSGNTAGHDDHGCP
jgi:hypothetical protein